MKLVTTNSKEQKKTPDEMIKYYEGLVEKYPIISIEDPFGEDDWDNYAKFTAAVGDKVQIVDDDLVVTNPAIVRDAIKKGCGNAVLIKLNQIGTVTETLQTIRMAKKNGWTVMMSHRSGETGDTFIADFAVATESGEIKTGAMARSERVEKYNQLLRIEEELKGTAPVARFPHSVDFD